MYDASGGSVLEYPQSGPGGTPTYLNYDEPFAGATGVSVDVPGVPPATPGDRPRDRGGLVSGDQRGRRAEFGDPEATDGLLGTNWYQELAAAFAGVGVEGREAPDQAVLKEQPVADRIAGTLPIRAFLDEEDTAAEEAAEWLSFGAFDSGSGR